jgi:ATP-dependent DNA ligase
MLAPTRVPHAWEIGWPVLASEKIDGVRNLVYPGFGSRSRSGCTWRAKALPGHLAGLQAVADHENLVFDGEFWIPGLTPREIQDRLFDQDADLSGLQYLVFDAVDYREFEGEAVTPFLARHERALGLLTGFEPGIPWGGEPVPRGVMGVSVLEQRPLAMWSDLCLLYHDVRLRGGEGLMIRRPDGPYRHGRCSMEERAIFKIKPIHANSLQTDIPCGLEV